MTKISWKPGTMLFPLPPVMVTCGTMEKPNVLTIAWTGIVNSEPPLTYISVRPSRFSHTIISENKEFCINLVNLPLAKACDYCGIKSGATTDKIKDMNLELEDCSQIKAPQLKSAPVTLECKVLDSEKMDTHEMFLAEIVNVNIDDKYIEPDNRLAVEKMGLVAFAHGRYYTLGRDLGAFGFSVDKTKANKTKPRKSQFMEILKIEKQFKDGTLKIKEKKPSLKKALLEKKAQSDKHKSLRKKKAGEHSFSSGNRRKQFGFRKSRVALKNSSKGN